MLSTLTGRIAVAGGPKPEYAAVAALAGTGRSLAISTPLRGPALAAAAAAEAWLERTRRCLAKRNSGQRLRRCLAWLLDSLERAQAQWDLLLLVMPNLFSLPCAQFTTDNCAVKCPTHAQARACVPCVIPRDCIISASTC